MMRNLFNLLRVGRVRLADDSDVIQRLQVDEGPVAPDGGARLIDGVKFVGQFGFASVPPLGAEVLLVAFGGDRSQTLGIGTNHQPSRLRDLSPGDAALYDVRGRKITLTEDGILIDAAGGPITIENATDVTIKASTKVRIEAPHVEVTGDVISRADGTQVSLNALHDAYNAHKHGSVQTGTSSTGLSDHLA